jgi:transforming growth factor-beta-induced protein
MRSNPMTNRRTRTLVALFAAGSLALAACGDDGDVASTGTTTTTEADAADDAMDDVTDDDAMDDEAADGETIVDIAAGNPDFSILVAAVTEAGLVDTLSGDGPFTVFAPTDEAFEAALEALGITAEELLANPALGDILTYHVLSGEVMSSDLEPTQTVATVQGEEVTITVDDAGARINDAEIVQTDIEASNGVIHVIDAVILPPTVAEALGV